ncbi:hypothetical protein EJ06DRAFT_532177 [Trichodelitschia bisporula]|uniref:L-ornithine N(5)-monooxygenase [NAD(P)H] n=1 Tax=Trichodelitschia bisporula TaxID=703511 RepID=A0A6G1HQU4_9PEZI|nr:hypothetical protein EJ06DRAFT_532177 [Trichodelitschia bisporula]
MSPLLDMLPEHLNGGAVGSYAPAPIAAPVTSLLPPTSDDELHDLICVGFGPASLAIAIAMHDALDPSLADSSSPLHTAPKALFLERQTEFAWHAGMLIPGAKMQISFIKDMASMRNPRSKFTFLSYLHAKGRLVSFANLNTFLPHRAEFQDYLRWCADAFAPNARYGQEVVEVRPDAASRRGGRAVRAFEVVSRDLVTGQVSVRRARHVVVATGGQASIPAPFPANDPRVIHSSQYQFQVGRMFSDRLANWRFAVVGSGQSAAEIFSDLHARYPNCRTRLLIKSDALKPSDDSPFVNEIFDPDRVDPFFVTPTPRRRAILAANKATNYGVVRENLLNHIYETLYMQRLTGAPTSSWPHRIIPGTVVTSIETPASSGPIILNTAPVAQETATEGGVGYVKDEMREFDGVFVATGYRRDLHETILASSSGLLPAGAKDWDVGRDYRVRFAEGEVAPSAGVWLQGCCEETHGLSDSLLSILAVRGGEIVQSMFGDEQVFREGKGKAVNGTA